nr:hypothetical protein [Frigoriglobus tundricola]
MLLNALDERPLQRRQVRRAARQLHAGEPQLFNGGVDDGADAGRARRGEVVGAAVERRPPDDARDRLRDPIDGHEVAALGPGERQPEREPAAPGFAARLRQAVRQFEEPVHAAVRGGVPRPAVADDDGRAVHRGAQLPQRPEGEFRRVLAVLVIVVVPLAEVAFRFEDRAGPVAAHERGRDVVDLVNAHPRAVLQEPAAAGRVGRVRLAVRPAVQRGAGGGVQHTRAVSRDPVAVHVAHSEPAVPEVAGENRGLLERLAGGRAGELHHFADALLGAPAPVRPHEDRDPVAGGQEVAQQVPAEQPGRAGEQNSVPRTHHEPPARV